MSLPVSLPPSSIPPFLFLSLPHSLSSLPYLPTPPSSSPPFPSLPPLLQSSFPDNFIGYEVLYWPISTTNYSSRLPPGRSTGVTLPLNSLRIFTRYAVTVRLYCSNGTGPASPVEEFQTQAERKPYQIHLSIIHSEVVPFRNQAKQFESWPNGLEAEWIVYKHPEWLYNLLDSWKAG